MVIFGASGDLTSRKLIPALYRLYQRKRLPPETRILGVARSPLSSEDWRSQLAESTASFLQHAFTTESWHAFAQNVFYQPGDIDSQADFAKIVAKLDEIERGNNSARVYYISTMPQLYQRAIEQLGVAGLADDTHAPRRIVIEKPFGTDLASAHGLNEYTQRHFREDQVYRIDHYLGKETVQNILVLRFGNLIFEPLWNRNYVDHVQITVAEEVTVGRRGGYYDGSGVLRDMFQNHLFQLMMVIAMECPARFTADLVRDEKVKVLQAVRAMSSEEIKQHSVRGQYAGYLNENGVESDSQTETFAALKLHVDNWRWKGVPFYLRSGKGMSCRTTQIVVQFREPPHILFGNSQRTKPEGNRLVIQIQPAEGIQLHFESKVPNEDMRLRLSQLDYRFDGHQTGELQDSYQRLLQDAMLGDASLFARSDEVEWAWRIIDPIIENWRGSKAPELHSYPCENWGPHESSQWIERDRRTWFDVCPVIR